MIYSQLLLDLHEEIIVDLFAGGGGASCGIEMATGRQVDVAINHDRAAIEMHRINHPQTKHFRSDVFEVDPRSVVNYFNGRRVGLLWLSPDCTFHSKARGGKPIRDKFKRRRALAWIAVRWAGQVKPRVIMLENVEEFQDWSPLVGPPDALRPDRKRKGKTFRRWVKMLEGHGYKVEWRELRACDYGAPTSRKRLFVIARCDGEPIVWPEPTHGPNSKRKTPYRSAAECIDFSIPACSIFATKKEAKAWGKAHGVRSPKRPLAENTLKRVARSVNRFVLNSDDPFIVSLQQGGSIRSVKRPSHTFTASKKDCNMVAMPIIQRDFGTSTAHRADDPMAAITAGGGGHATLVTSHLESLYSDKGNDVRASDIEDPVRTVTASPRHALVSTYLQSYYGDKGENDVRGSEMREPIKVQTTENRHAVVSAFLAQHNGGNYKGDGHSVEEPCSTITTTGSQQGLVETVLAPTLVQSGYGERKGQKPRSLDIEKPVGALVGSQKHALATAHLMTNTTGHPGSKANGPSPTVTTGGHHALVQAFLLKYYGAGTGQSVDESAHTITTNDRLGLVTVQGVDYRIVDITLRMLQPRELYRCQGFPEHYIIDWIGPHEGCPKGRKLAKYEQVRMVGNSVPPQFVQALVRANCPELIARQKLAA